MTQVFSKDWFLHHQKTLLWLANHWLTKRWFRWVLRIRRCDCPIDTKINQILPNSFTYNVKLKGDKLEATTDFRVNDKFARRLYFAFRPLWYVLHGWDWATTKRPDWNLGFDTLTQYPGSIGANNPCDGYVNRTGVNETWSTIRNGDGKGAETGQLYLELDCSSTTNQFVNLYRIETLFDTSSLTADADISGATYSLYEYNKGTNLTGTMPSLDCVSSNPTSTSAIASGDYAIAKWGTTVYDTIGYSSIAGGYNDWTLDANGIANISLTGISKFGVRYDWDTSGTFGGTWGSSKYNFVQFRSAANTGTSADPKLVITYSLASTTPAFALLLGCG